MTEEEGIPPPEVRREHFIQNVTGCPTFIHDGVQTYAIATIKDGKMYDDGSETAKNAKKILNALGIHRIHDRQVVLLGSWDEETQDGAYQLVGYRQYQQWLHEAGMSEVSPN